MFLEPLEKYHALPRVLTANEARKGVRARKGARTLFPFSSGALQLTIAGNYIGTNQAGTAAIGNETGVHLTDGVANALLGTNADGVSDDLEKNIISGNTNYGRGTLPVRSGYPVSRTNRARCPGHPSGGLNLSP